MFELFLDVIPIYHAKLLDELPLAAALHHNNTMFIAHHITTFGILFKGRLPQDLKVIGASFITIYTVISLLCSFHFIYMSNV